MRLICLIAISATLLPVNAFSQQSQPSSPQPKTQIEAFSGQVGSVIVKEYQDIASIAGGSMYGKVDVSAMKFKDARNGKESSGILIEAEIRERDSRTYIDYDEIVGLLEGIDYVKSINGSSSKMPYYEAKYSTRGELSITGFNQANGTKSYAVTVGRIGSQTVYIDDSKLSELKAAFSKAKEAIDVAK